MYCQPLLKRIMQVGSKVMFLFEDTVIYIAVLALFQFWRRLSETLSALQE